MATRSVDRNDNSTVGSRVSWGPVLAGALVALAIFFTLSLLGAAVGLSARESFDREELGLGAGVWSILALAIGLFVGGWVVSKCTVGENRTDAILNGTIVWGTTLSLLLFLTGTNLSSGVNASTEKASDRDDGPVAAAPASLQQSAERGAVREDTLDATRNALWGAFAAALASLGAAVSGAIVGPNEVVRRDDIGRRPYDDRATITS